MKNKIVKIIFCLYITIAVSMYILIAPVYAFSPASPDLHEGIDVSGWQGNINFEEVKNAGIEIVYMKASEGSNFVDPYFNQNYTNAKANGLKVGFYHYLTAKSEEEAVLEATFFVATISSKVPECRLAMDFESFGDLSVEQINKIGLAFVKTVEDLTKKELVIYSDTSNATSVFEGELTRYPLWVAQYEVEEPTPNGKWNNWVRLAIYRFRRNFRNKWICG